VEHKEITGHLYYIRYPLADGTGFITVATTRPETFFGDTAVAVNPGDGRYKDLVGKKVVLPVINKEIPVIADDAVDISFGTGALKITPAHDPTDFEVAQRHNLPMVDIMNPDATLNKDAGPYAGLERFACRDKVVDDLREKGLLEKIEPYLHSVGHCIRCQTMVEPRISLQWFIHTKPLAEKAIKVVKNGSIAIIPERFTKVYFEWMENIRDWCISRQLWWGHRIPVWYCRDCGELTVSVDAPSQCSHCGSSQITQDPDVLDTWFSSALWTHSTLGWPDDTEDLRYFYPGTVMETGYDILFFWVARMIMMGLENTGEIPFRTVYLHGLIRDEHGEKMSKLRGNVINPAEAVNEYGVDALRFALASNSTPGNDINLGKGKLEASRNFVNKLWNATRFIFQSMDIEASRGHPLEIKGGPQLLEDRWIVSRLNRLITEVNNLMEDSQFGEACRQIYDFIWSEFCDWYVEFAKIRLRVKQPPVSPLPFLVNTLECSLRLLHPFMPFITEELWQNLKQRLPDESQMSDSIIIAPYPITDSGTIDSEAERAMDAVIEIIRSIRNVRAQYKVEAAKQIEALVYTGELLPQISSQAKVIEPLARVNPLTIAHRKQRKGEEGKAVILVLKESEVILPWAGLVNLSAEEQRLVKESEMIQMRVAQLETRLQDSSFLTKAPQHVVDREKQRLDMLKSKLERIEAELSQLRS
jgi:valyl-tRNA synthetase